MQDDNYKNKDYDNELIALANLIYKETEKTLLTRECEQILINLLTSNLFDNKYIIDEEKINKVKTL